MNNPSYIGTQSATSPIVVNKVLKNTYALLSMTLLFSALTAYYAMKTNMAPMGMLITFGGYFGLLFLTNYLRNSAWGLLSVFALTGFLGLTIGPMVNAYTNYYTNGSEIVMMAMGGTGIIFLTLSGIALTSKTDFSFMRGFLTVGILVAFLAGIGAAIFQVPALSLAVSAAFLMLMSGLLLYYTQQIVRGGETNYIMATVTLFVAIFNIFMSLLHLLGALTGDD